MKLFKVAMLSLALTSLTAGPVFAQFPGEAKPPRSYDPVGDMQFHFAQWAPSSAVRELQQALRDQGYYRGPLDGVLNPEFRTAIWKFQRAKGLPTTARLDGSTVAAIGVPATGTASPGPAASSFGAVTAPSHLNDVEAP